MKTIVIRATLALDGEFNEEEFPPDITSLYVDLCYLI